MTPEIDDFPARLPEGVLVDLLQATQQIAVQVDTLLGPVAEQRKQLRQHLLDDGIIQPVGAPVRGASVVAVDGGAAHDELYAVDVVAAVAVAAEGLRSQPLPPSGPGALRPPEAAGHETWIQIQRHAPELERLAQAAMFAMELALLDTLTNDVCIFDGSHLTAAVRIGGALCSQSAAVRRGTVELCERFGVVEALARFSDPAAGARFVALPKADSSRCLSSRFEARYGLCLPATDKFLAAQVLEPGEMFRPAKVPRSWEQLHVGARSGAEAPVRDLAAALDEAIDPLRRRGQGQGIGVTYVKPESCSTALRVELKASRGREHATWLARVLSDETPGPYLQEPYAQHQADLWAKSIGVGVDGAIQAMRLAIAGEGDPSYLEYLLRSYRTTMTGGRA
ncbi:MAG TPA: hypothetical protein VKG45_08750 [Actinomycetes bacterium]|nr:hypothetical protein [Actinomycetes bacterium]